MKMTKNALLLALSVGLTACGGGGSDNPVQPATDTETQIPPTSQIAIQSGRFVDSAVQGLRYRTDTRNGTTDDNGTFEYAASESIVFSIGSIDLPPVAADDLITPLSVFNTTDISRIEVINLARLLQTLDTDGNAINGINISDEAHQSATGLTIDFASNSFDDSVSNLIANSGSILTTLIGGESALDHLAITLLEEGVTQAPNTDNGVDSIPTDECNVSSSFDGNSSAFSSFAHSVSGTLTVVDGCTLRIDNFSYDGGGPSVYFYLGAGGDFSSRGAGMQIGPQLNGRAYTNESITINLPDGINLNDFDAVSVWCDIFFADFGNAGL